MILIIILVGGLIVLDYCDKCGWFWQRPIQDENNSICGYCEICKNQLKPVPNEYYEEFEGIQFLSKKMKQKLIQELVLPSANFDQYYFDNAINIKGQRDDEFQAKMNHGKAILQEQGRQIKCTYCGSTNVKKIGYINRGLSTYLWGLASKKITKQWHCNNCGSDF